MYPLFVRTVGKFFDMPAARAAIEKVVQPGVNVALNTLGKAEWYKVTKTFFETNSASIVTALTSVAFATDVVSILKDSAKTSEDEQDLAEIAKIVGKTAPMVSSKSSSGCQLDPVAAVSEINQKRAEVRELANIFGITERDAVKAAELFSRMSNNHALFMSII